jgi:hypothetical protein
VVQHLWNPLFHSVRSYMVHPNLLRHFVIKPLLNPPSSSSTFHSVQLYMVHPNQTYFTSPFTVYPNYFLSPVAILWYPNYFISLFTIPWYCHCGIHCQVAALFLVYGTTKRYIQITLYLLSPFCDTAMESTVKYQHLIYVLLTVYPNYFISPFTIYVIQPLWYPPSSWSTFPNVRCYTVHPNFISPFYKCMYIPPPPVCFPLAGPLLLRNPVIIL